MHRHIKSPKSERMHDICVISNQFDNSCYFLIGFVSHKGKVVILKWLNLKLDVLYNIFDHIQV